MKQTEKERRDKKDIKYISSWIPCAALSRKGLQESFQLKFTESLIEVIIKLLLARKRKKKNN